MGVFAPYDAGSCASRCRSVNLVDGRDLPEIPPNGVEPPAEKKGRGRLIGRTKGGLHTKLDALTDRNGKPLDLFLSAGQVSDYTGGAALLSSLPEADSPLTDRGYDADWFRYALKTIGITPCIPERKSRETPIKDDRHRYPHRSLIDRKFGRLKD